MFNRALIMATANRLSQTMARSVAFRKAWEIGKNGLELPVKGVTFGNRQEALRRLATEYAENQIWAFIVPEDNPHDPNALAVMVGVQGGKGLYKIGYVPAEKTNIVRAIKKVPAFRVVSGTWGKYLKTTYGARIAL